MDPLQDIVRKTWGYDTLRPLQREAMQAALDGRDALVVLPTGGGKSLCYQAPALLSGKTTVVVSPLISLMKDQVDRLLSRNVPAAFLNSSLDSGDRHRVRAGIARSQYKLVFVAPERFSAGDFAELIDPAQIGAFAIDEAHCISHWGHDFRGDYRELGRLKREYPGVPIHAFTATATPRVREDIVSQLGLQTPEILVGDFFRPNLRYLALPRDDAFQDVLGEVQKRAGQAGIVYCIRRADVDSICEGLQKEGVRAEAYHAGLGDEERTKAQDRFITGEVDVVVATVAFGMGIDRADIRYVLHAAMPKSIEHYQQETGRAGRDGQPADCVLFYSGADYQLWHSIISKNEPSDPETKLRMLGDMYGFCRDARCRHRRLVEYFGQAWDRAGCGACDVCLGLLGALPDSNEIARGLLAGILVLDQRFGPVYVAEVLSGLASDRVKARNHQDCSVFGSFAGKEIRTLTSWLNQLVDQGVLYVEGEYGVLRVTPKGAQVMRGLEGVSLYGTTGSRPPRPAKKASGRRTAEERKAAGEAAPLEGDARDLFQRLRDLRRRISDEEGRPAFMVFSDRTLREMSRLRPKDKDGLLKVHGIGFAKLEAYGDAFLKVLKSV